MRIALCLSGHARTYAFTKQFWNHYLLSQFQTDVFMHIWDTIGPRSFGPNRSEHSPLPREDYNSGINNSPRADVTHIINVWNPTSIVVENYNGFHEKFSQMITPILHERDRRGIPAGFEHHHPLSVRSMLYKRFQCNQLKSNYETLHNIKYDIVIQTRPDVVLTNGLIDKIFSDRSKIYFHNCRSNTPDPEINDFGAIGTSNQIDTWCNLYNKVDGVFNKIKHEENFFKFLNPHKMYVQYLMQENQPYEELDIHLSVVRDTGHVLGWDHSKKIIQGVM